MLPKKPPIKKELNTEDIDLLNKISEGESLNSIAYRNGHSPEQIRYKVEGIKQYLRATTLPEMVAAAFRKGFLH